MQIRILDTIKEITKEEWTPLIGSHFPFAEYEFLLALEQGQCVGGDPGWIPQYVTAWNDGHLVGAIYLYEKYNSNGEYIFDWAWANAYAQNGLHYYPKLVSAIPFTPATGQKILVHPQADHQEVAQTLLQSVIQIMTEKKCSSAHFLFIPESEIPLFEQAGFFIRHSYQFHWKNRNYSDFDMFLSALKGKRRKEILRERRKVKEQDLEIHVLTGEDLTLEHSRVMYNFYCSTIYKRGAIDYLTSDFFNQVFTTMKDHIVLILAQFNGKWVAGAINYLKGNSLYGRYWGCAEEFNNLHFELCYYQAIEYAINHKIELFEAGAQGEHKIQRGFLPEITYSAHVIGHSGFQNAIYDFVEKEKRAITENFTYSEKHMPYRNEN